MTRTWDGDRLFLLSNLILKDFRVRYRNMSLGVLWSLLNPIVMVVVLTFVFTNFFASRTIPHFALYILCGLIPFNFFALGWMVSTVSLVDNASLIKHVDIPREIVPVASVLSNCIHLFIQLALLLAVTLAFGLGINVYWLWLPIIWMLEIVFVCGLGLAFSAMDVYLRDTRYFVESSTTVLFWLVPLFYPMTLIPPRARDLYEYNPIAALVILMRQILLDGQSPSPELMGKLAITSIAIAVAGFFFFKRLSRRFYDYL